MSDDYQRAIINQLSQALQDANETNVKLSSLLTISIESTMKARADFVELVVMMDQFRQESLQRFTEQQRTIEVCKKLLADYGIPIPLDEKLN
jgi:hypothetical protein